ncbi:MAG: hypothetical protein WCK00_07655, partial [Deltaproteobacteria bacterium]
KTREQILNISMNILETPPLMNGGHYMTKGHNHYGFALYQDNPDVKRYFGTGGMLFFGRCFVR